MNRRKTCRACGGSKKVMDLGYMFKTCEECGGIGYLEVNEQTELAIEDIKDAETHGDIELNNEKPKKKRGRPPKNTGKDS